jgi:hypothetical protein
MNERTPYQDYLDRISRTPTSEAEIILTNLEDAYRRLVIDRNSNKKIPKELKLEDCKLHETTFFKELATGALSGDELVRFHKRQYPPNEDGVFELDELHAIVISLAYCVHAIRADTDGKRDLAWTYIIDSRTWFTSSLSLKPKRIENINNRRAVSYKRTLAAKSKHEKLYQPHIDFILDLYRSGVESGKWKNPHQAVDEIHKLLNARIEENKDLWRTSPENRRVWVYEKLLESQK